MTDIEFFFFNDTATTEIYTLSLHDALPISFPPRPRARRRRFHRTIRQGEIRSEEHTSELQSLAYLVCRLLLEKKKTDLPPARSGLPLTAATPLTPRCRDSHTAHARHSSTLP